MDNWLEYVLILGLILLNAFFAASEIAIVTIRKSRVRQLAEEGRGGARSILRLTDNSSRFLATIQIGVTLTSFFASAFGAVSLVKIFEDWFKSIPVSFISSSASTLAFTIVTILIAFLSLVFGELVPKTLAIETAEPIALRVARPIEILAKITGPIVAALTAITNFFVRLLGGHRRATLPSVSEEEIVSMVETGQEEGVLEKQESEIIGRVFEFSDRQVREIMVPRVDIAMLDANTSVQVAARQMVSSGYSRYPLFRGTNREEIIGIAYVKDILKYMTESQLYTPIGQLARGAYFIPESKRVGELLTELQRSHTQMAIVIDEYGGLAGLVTLEDCLEEIVGEIRDEFDTEEENRIRPQSDGSYLADGATPLNEINQKLELDLEDEEIDTIGGLVLKRLGHIASPGETVELVHTRQVNDPDSDDVKLIETLITIRVEKIEGLRIREVRLTLRELKPDPVNEGQAEHDQVSQTNFE